MARLAVSIGGMIAGAAIGFAIAGPAGIGLGLSLGGLVGGIAGSFIGNNTIGPRLQDLQVSSSAPGNSLPFGYGQARLGGQIIWAQQIVEQNISAGGGKGGPQQTDYNYTCSFAASFGEGPGQIVQVWGDTQCVYDTTGTQQLSNLEFANGHPAPLNLAFYPGDEFQMPDPTIVSLQGANLTPAFRGQVYMVADYFNLQTFGNRVPNIRAVVNYGSNAPNFPNFSTTDNTRSIIVDQINRVYYAVNADGTHWSKYSLVDNSLIFKQVEAPWGTQGYTAYFMSPQAVQAYTDSNGFIWCFLYDSNNNTYPLCQLNPNTLAIVNSYNLFGVPVSCNYFAPGDGYNYFIVFSNNTLYKFRLDDATIITETALQLNYPQSISFLTFGQFNIAIDGLGNAYVAATSAHYGEWYIWKLGTPTPVFSQAGVSGVGNGAVSYLMCNPQNNTIMAFTDTGMIYLIDASGWTTISVYGNVGTSSTWPGANTPVSINTLCLDTNGNVQECTGGGETGPYQPGSYPPGEAAQSWNPDIGGQTNDGSVKWACLGPSPFFTGGGMFGIESTAQGFGGMVQNGILLLPNGNITSSGKARVVRASDLTTLSTFDFFADFAGGGSAVVDWRWDPVYCSVIASNFSSGSPPTTVIDRAYIQRNGSAGETLDAIVADLAERCGIPSTALDLSAISGINCLGYVVTNPSSAAACIGPLCQAYLFDLVESDFSLKAVPRGQANNWTIPETDLGLEDDKRELQETLEAYTDIPHDVIVTYIDPALDYQQGSQIRHRHSATTKSLNQLILNVPFIMSQTDAMQLADKLTWIAELERQMFEVNLWKSLYMLMDPTDVIQFTYEGLEFIARVPKVSIGKNFAVEIQGVNQNADSYLSSMAGTPQTGFNKGGVAAFGPTILFLLDMPLLQDGDASPLGETGTYFAFASPVVGNPGAVLYQSSDGQVWTADKTESDHIAYGFSTNALGTPRTPWSWDYTNTLTLFFSTPGITISSTSALNVCNGANGVIVGKELIQFQTATHNSDGSCTLSGLLRGRRGTEWACAGHVAGEICFFPQVQHGIHRQVMTAGLIGLLRYFKAITVGGDLNSGSQNNFTLAANDVKPYSPVQVAGTKDGSGNLTIQWQRRTRIGAGANIAGTWPVSEVTESYDVVITDSMGVVKRTFSNVTPPGGGWTSPAFPNVDYTSAQQTTDFGGVQSTYYFQIFQNSAFTFEDGTHRGFETKCVLAIGLSTGPKSAVETFIYH